ncbi:hypothetical protein F5B20DRAFT_132231 [Whalleya microplaca]|nr:hypothetical protein F5B20DRAFT_132231 [Whalleya microplaca]
MAATQDRERRSGSRQSHKKSRNSCMPCRRRRVRCNLQPPICANCHRRNEHCSYEQQKIQELNVTRLTNTHMYTHTKLSGFGNVPLDGLSLGYANSDLDSRVLRDEASLSGAQQAITEPISRSINWVTEKTFILAWLSDREKSNFAQEFDYQANAFQYVHQTIIALCALHEWSLRPPHPFLYATAYEHHIAASVLFRNSQAEVNEANWIATLMFGVGVIIFQFATALKTSDGANEYLEMLQVLRSSFSVSKQLGPFIHSSPLMRFTGPYLSQRNAHLDAATWNAVCSLESLDYPGGTTDETRYACLHSTAALKEWVIDVDGHPENWRHFIHWPAAVSEQYLSALSRRHPVALVIFVYWCAIMCRSPKRWYMDGWANRAADAAVKHLRPEWNYVLVWPLSMLSSEFRGAEYFELILVNRMSS